MSPHAVRVDALRDLAVERPLLKTPAGARGAGLRVDDDVLWRDQALLQQRDERELRRRGVASRIGNEPRGLDGVAADLGQAVNRFALEVDGDVGRVVPLLVGLDVCQAEVRREVDDLQMLWQARDDLLRLRVRKASEHHVDIGVVHVFHLHQIGQLRLK
eukprot:scaffold8431_cov248-Pinguiococcus_pyrenoidosus.AAC.3